MTTNLSPSTRRSVSRGLKQSAQGKRLYLGSFTNPIKSSTELDDRITDILIAYAKTIRERDGHVDIVTIRNAKVSILELVAETNSNPKLRKLAAQGAATTSRL